MDKFISIGEAAELAGVSVDTIRRWEKSGKVKSERTDGNHRRYRRSDFVSQPEGITILYARVSSHDQKADLERQEAVLQAYAESNGWDYRLISDLGSGLNYRKKGLHKLITLLLEENVARLIITHKDRLLSFGSELIFSICEHNGIEVIMMNRKEDSTFEEDLAKDVLEIITVFSARLYGSRSRKNQKLLENLTENLAKSVQDV